MLTAPAIPSVSGMADETGQEWWAGHTRVPDRARLPPAPVPVPVPAAAPPAPPSPTAVPEPGRHAARRRAAAPRVPWPETLRGRVDLGAGQVAVVAVLVAIGMSVTTWWVIRGDATPVSADRAAEAVAGSAVGTPAPALVPLSGGASAAPDGVDEAEDVDEARITVDVAGRVRRPGIAVLAAGSRVADALAAAGGARRGVDLATLNLARPLVDGEQVLVGRPTLSAAGAVAGAGAGAAGPTGIGASGVAPPANGLVNLNTATAAELDTLPEVGPVTAEAILAWRDQHGGFTAVDELLEVDGIGEATLARIAPHATV